MRWGVRGRLLLAFMGISAFAAIAAVAGIFSLAQVGDALDRVTEERVPQAFSWVDLSRRAERIVQAAPTLLIVKSQNEREQVALEIAREIELLEQQMAQRDETQTSDGDFANRIRPAAQALGANLTTLDRLMGERLEIVDRKNNRLRTLATTNRTTTRLFVPATRQLETRLVEWERLVEAAAAALSPDASTVARDLVSLIPQQETARLIRELHDALAKLGAAETLAEIPVLEFPVQRLLQEIEALTGYLPRQVQRRLNKHLAVYRGLGEGPDSLATIRKAELEVLGRAEQVLAENARVSAELKTALDALVEDAHDEILLARAEAARVEEFSAGLLITVVVLSLLSSALIFWLYVNRNLIARLTGLSDSMLAIAGGNLHATLPKTAGNDEISGMAKALSVFRDTAVEVEENNLREVATARQRLVDAIESISEGFAFFDANDRLELCNSRYRDFIHDPEGKVIRPGMTFAEIARATAEHGTIQTGELDVESYVAERVQRHNTTPGPRLYRLGDGRWVQINERKIAGGGTVAIYSDLTELKRRQEQTEAINRQLSQTLDNLKSTQAQLVEAEKMAALGSLVAGVAHEINTPVGIGVTAASLLMEQTDILCSALQAGTMKRSQLQAYLDTAAESGAMILSNLNRAAGLIQSFKQVAVDQSSEERRIFTVKPYLEEILLSLQPTLKRTRLKITVRGDDTLVLDSYPGDLSQIVTNLVMNSLIHAYEPGQEGELVFVVSRGRDSVMIEYSDDGCGISEQNLSRVFDPFFTTRRGQGGSGLGLHIIYNLVTQRLGGSIHCTSEVGAGTRFSIELPSAANGDALTQVAQMSEAVNTRFSE